MEKRKATYTITIPMQIVLVADNDLTVDELEKIVEKETYKKLAEGSFEIFTNDYEITKKRAHYSLKEKKEQKKLWDRFFNDMFETRGNTNG